MRRTLCLSIALGSVLAFTASACGGSTAPTQRVSFVIGADSLAGLPTSPATSYRGTRRYFEQRGIRSSPHIIQDDCGLKLKAIGLSALFWSFGDRAAPRYCTEYGGVVVSGARWHTPNGLRIGATVAELHRLFPRALYGGPVGRPWWGWEVIDSSSEWFLGPKWPVDKDHAAHTVLSAYVKGGRVVAFGQEISGH